jgi:hypothetical protein
LKGFDGWRSRAPEATTAFGVEEFFIQIPKVARASQPWAMGITPLGLEEAVLSLQWWMLVFVFLCGIPLGLGGAVMDLQSGMILGVSVNRLVRFPGLVIQDRFLQMVFKPGICLGNFRLGLDQLGLA